MTPPLVAEDVPLAEDFVDGSIVRLKCDNFMTFSNCEFRPGARLNVILGPNGTGKSSLVCALALGLGGTPATIGRGEKLESFVKRGCEHATVEVELRNKDPKYMGGKNIVVAREFTKDNGVSQWRVNGKTVTQAEAKTIFAHYNIQVDNLCQFLPQERVGEFSKFDEIQLLDATVVAVLGVETLEMKHVLIKSQKEFQEKRKQLDSELVTCKQLEEENERLEREVQRQLERKQKLEELNVMRKLLPWVEFEEEQGQVKKIKEEKEAREQELNKLERSLGPIKRAAAECKEKKVEAERLESAAKKAFEDLENKVKNAGLDTKGDELEEREHQLEELKKSKAKAQERVGKLEKEIAALKVEIESGMPEEEYRAKLAELRKEVAAATAAVNVADAAVAVPSAEMSRLTIKLNQLKGRSDQSLNATENSERDLRFKRLFGGPAVRDRIKAALRWIEMNPTKLKGKVYGPLGCEVDVKEQDEMVRMVLEDFVQPKMWGFLVGTCTEDHGVMSRALGDGQRVPMVAVDDPGRRQSPPPPPLTRQQLQEMNVMGFLDEFVVGNDLAVEALRRLSGIHRVLLASPTLDAKGQSEALTRLTAILKQTDYAQKVTIYFVKTKTKAEITRSAYDKHMLTTTTIIKGQGGGDQRMKFFVASIAAAAAQSEAAKQAQARLDEERRKIETELGKVRELKSAAEAKKQGAKEAETKVKNSEAELRKSREKIERAKGLLKSKNSALMEAKEEAEKNWTVEIEKKSEDILKFKMGCEETVGLVMRNLARLHEAGMSLMAATAVKSARTGEQDGWMDVLKEFQDRNGELRARMEELKKTYEGRVANLKLLYERAKKATGGNLTDELRAKLQELPNDSLVLKEQIATLEQVVGAIFKDDGVVNHYEERKRQLAASRDKVQELEKACGALLATMETKKEEWEAQIKSMIENVDVKFRGFFEEVGKAGYACQGEVTLLKDEQDFSKYGIGLLVKFRANQKLMQLRADVHSGGERSLTTFLYMLALQQSARCPFRLVDEINQGMDPDKERLAYDRLVSVSCGRREVPQYFLITPKLLVGLKFPEDSKVIFVLNGPGILKQDQWNFNAFAAAAARARGEGGVRRALGDISNGGGSNGGANKRARTMTTTTTAASSEESEVMG